MKTFKRHDEEIIEELYKHWLVDEKKYIKETRRFSAQLESILIAGQEESIHESEKAWDIMPLREEIRQMNAGSDEDLQGQGFF
jgi:hypothetical protein